MTKDQFDISDILAVDLAYPSENPQNAPMCTLEVYEHARRNTEFNDWWLLPTNSKAIAKNIVNDLLNSTSGQIDLGLNTIDSFISQAQAILSDVESKVKVLASKMNTKKISPRDAVKEMKILKTTLVRRIQTLKLIGVFVGRNDIPNMEMFTKVEKKVEQYKNRKKYAKKSGRNIRKNLGKIIPEEAILTTKKIAKYFKGGNFIWATIQIGKTFFDVLSAKNYKTWEKAMIVFEEAVDVILPGLVATAIVVALIPAATGVFTVVVKGLAIIAVGLVVSFVVDYITDVLSPVDPLTPMDPIAIPPPS